MLVRGIQLVLAFCAILGSSNAFSQSRTGRMLVGTMVGGVTDSVARHLAQNMAMRYTVSNMDQREAPSAAQGLRGAATDGSVLMVVFINSYYASIGRTPSPQAFSFMTPVAMLGEYQTNSGGGWLALFAPPGTPESVVRAIAGQARQALANPPAIGGEYGAALRYAPDMSASALSQRMRFAPSAARLADDPKSVGGGASPK